METRVPGYRDTRVRLTRRRSKTLKGEQIVYGNPGTRVPVSAWAQVPRSGSASTASHPVGYPVPNLEAWVQLYA